METNNPKILYITSIPWGWIKQRPQFIAESLAKDFQIDVYYKKPNTIKKSDLLNKENTSIKNLRIRAFRLFPFHAVPVLRKFNLKWLNRFILKFQMPDFKNYKIIWITSASLFKLIKKEISSNQILIYDCMDDILEFPYAKKNRKGSNILLQQETELLNRVFSSTFQN